MTDAFHMIIDTLRRVDPKGGLLVFALLSSVYAAFRGKNKAQRMLGAASLVLTALFVFPPAAAVLARFMRGGQVYWRFLWTVPSIQLTALLGTEAAAHPKLRAGRILALLAVCAILVLAGRCVYQPGTFQKAENREKLDRLTIETANLINANAEQTGNSYRRVLAPQTVRSEIRQVDATILSAIGRDLSLGQPGKIEADTSYGYGLLLLEGAIPDSQQKIYRIMKYYHCNYLLIRTASGTEETLASKKGTRLISRKDGWDLWYAARITDRKWT